MRWFKHFSDNHRGQGHLNLFNQMGHVGPCCYWILMEMCAEKLERKPDKTLEDSDLLFSFDLRLVRQNLRLSRTKLELFLGFSQGFGLFRYKIFENNLEIYMPILSDLLDRDLKKPRSERAKSALKTRLELESELELDKELESEIELDLPKTKKANKPKTEIQVAHAQKARGFIAAYCSLFHDKWGFNPDIRGKEAGIAKRVVKDLSEEKFLSYLNAFFNMPDAWLQKAKHPLAMFETKINEIAAFANNGTFVTNAQVRQGDEMASNMMLLNKIRKEGA